MKKLFIMLLLVFCSYHSFAISYFVYTKKSSNLPTYTIKKVFIHDHTPYFASDSGLYYVKGTDFKGWNNKNSELNNDFITDIAFKDSSIFIATISGLYEFNGILTFKHYTKENSNLPDDFIQRLRIGPDKETLFLASRNKIITLSKNIWKKISYNKNIGIIRDIQFYNKKMFVLTTKGLYEMNDSKLRLFSPPWLEKKTVTALTVSGNSFYIGSSSGLVIWNGENVREELDGFNIKTISIDASKKAWVGGNGFIAYEGIHGWEDLGSNIDLLKKRNIISIACDYDSSKKLISVFAVLRSRGIIKIMTYTSEELNTIEKLSKKIDLELSQKNYRKVEELAEQIIKYNPNHLKTLKVLASIYLKEEDYKRFFTTVSKILKLSPKSASTWFPAIASIYLDHGHYMEAAYILRLLALKNDAVALEKLASIYEKTAHFKDAIICLKKLFSIKKSIKPLFSLSKIYEKTGDLDNAESQLRKAVNEFPNTDRAYLELSRFYLRYQRADLSLVSKIISKSIEINPQNPSAYALKGYLLTLKGKFVEAESTLFRAIRIAPNNGEARIYLANLYFIGHKDLLLKQQLSECDRLIPNSPEYGLLKGKIYAFSGSFQAAIDTLQKVISIQPFNASAHFYLAKSYHSARFFKSAIKEYRNTLKLSPNFRFKAEIETALDKLTG